MLDHLVQAVRTGRLFGAVVLLPLLFPVPSAAQPVVIDFDGTDPALVLNQFASQGVTFNAPLLRDFSATPGFAHSGTKAIELCFAQEFCSTPLNVRFTEGQSRTKLWVGYSSQLGQATGVTLQALDGNGVLVGQATGMLGPSAGPAPVQTPLEVDSPSANIRQLVLRLAAAPGETSFNNGLVVDDVEFTTAGAPPPCNAAARPSVSLIQPPTLLLGSQVSVQTNEFMLQGVVFTDVPLDEATLIVTAGSNTSSSDLLASIVPGTGGTFGATRVNGALFPGTNTVSVRAKNCAGTDEDQGTVEFTPIAAGTGFQVVGLEVNQATQDLANSVPLVADKPTLVRVYVNVTGPTASINGVSGAITATRPGGPTLVPLLHSTNDITADSSTDTSAKRRNLAASLNFVLPPDWYAAGTVHFELSKLYIQSSESTLPCEGCGNVDEIGAPRYAVFRPTKALNLVLAPYEYTPSATPTPDILFTPMGALQWLNNVYPLAGRFPSSGSGIRILRILPARSTTRDLGTSGGIGDFLDDLQDLMNDLQDQSGNNWPSDARLFGMVPSGTGGAARMPGNVAYGDTWAVENGLVPQANYESYGAIWAQEIGHNFGREHVSTSHGEQPPSDSAFPFAHGGIGQPGLATITGYWIVSPPSLINPGSPIAGGRHAHDFMSYGSVNSPGGEHTRSWVSPFTYGALFKKFEVLSQALMVAPPQRTEKVVVVGRIGPNGAVILRPFRRVTTAFTTGPGAEGEYSVELVGAGGRTLLTHHFDAQEDGGTELPCFSEYVPWKNGTQLILIKRGGKVIAERSVSPHEPWVRVLHPKQDEVWGPKATIQWEAGDDDKDSLTFTILYNSGFDSIWLPIATGVTAQSAIVDTALLPGSPRARVRVRVTDGVNTAEAESDRTFRVSEKRPLVTILGPIDGQVLAPDASPHFVAAAYDPEDGILSGASMTWSSDRDGLLGRGPRPAMPPLSRGDHLITVMATDSQGHSARARVNVVVSRERLSPR